MTYIVPVGLIDAEFQSDTFTTHISFTCPEGVEDGDLLLMVAADLTGAPSMAAPPGWATLTVQNPSSTQMSGIFTRIASVSVADSNGWQDVPGSTNYAPAITTGRAVGALMAFRNFDAGNPLVTFATTSKTDAGVTSIPFGTITPTADGSYVIGFAIAEPVTAGRKSSLRPPDNYALDVNECTTSTGYGNLVLGMFTQQQVAAVPISGLTATVDDSSYYTTYLLAVNATADAAPPSGGGGTGGGGEITVTTLSIGGTAPTAVYLDGTAISQIYLQGEQLYPAPTPPSGKSSLYNVDDTTQAYMTAEDLTVGNYSANGYATTTGIVTNDGSILFDYYNMGTGATNEVATTHPITGVNGFHFKEGSTAASAYLAWIANTTHAVPEYISAQLNIAARGANPMIFESIRSTSNGSMVSVQLNADGTWELLGTGGALLKAGTTTIPLNQDVRIDLGLVTVGNPGHAIAHLYLDAKSSTPDETLDVSTGNTGSGLPGRDIFGLYNQWTGWEIYVDNMQKSNQDWPPAPTAA